MSNQPSIADDQVQTVIDLCHFGYTDDQIAERFNCSRPTVFSFRKKHKIRKKSGGRRPRKHPALVVVNPVIPIRVYFDAAVNHLVKVYAPRQASGDLPLEEHP